LRWYVECLTGGVAALLAIDDRSDGALEHLKVLVLAWMEVLWRKPSLTAVGAFHLESLLGDPEQLQAESVVAHQLLALMRHALKGDMNPPAPARRRSCARLPR
jgi:hypothetical protein